MPQPVDGIFLFFFQLFYLVFEVALVLKKELHLQLQFRNVAIDESFHKWLILCLDDLLRVNGVENVHHSCKVLVYGGACCYLCIAANIQTGNLLYSSFDTRDILDRLLVYLGNDYCNICAILLHLVNKIDGCLAKSSTFCVCEKHKVVTILYVV